MRKKYLMFITILAIMLSLCGCAILCSVTKEGLHNAVSKKTTSQTMTYDVPYEETYNAITSLLERRLRYGVSRVHTTKKIIYSSYLERASGTLMGFEYAYLFELKKIDDEHTQVMLKSSGSPGSVNAKDMLNKYIKEEVEYIRRMKE